MKYWLSAFARACVAAALVALLSAVPVAVLLRVAHRLPAWIDPKLLVFAFQSVLLLLALSLSCAWPSRLSPEPVTRSGLRAGGWLVLGTLMLSLLVSVSIVLSGPQESAGSSLPGTVARWVNGLPNTGMLGGIVLVCVLAPIYEEFLYRGFILGFLLQRAPTWFAFAMSTILFAVLHDSWLFGALGGLAYGLLYLRYANVWLCSLVHGAHNLLSAAGVPMVVAYLYDARILVPIEASLLPLQVTWLLAAFACFAMFLWETLGGLDEGAFRLMLRPRPSLA